MQEHGAPQISGPNAKPLLSRYDAMHTAYLTALKRHARGVCQWVLDLVPILLDTDENEIGSLVLPSAVLQQPINQRRCQPYKKPHRFGSERGSAPEPKNS